MTIESLKQKKIWVNWNYQSDGKKPTKVPIAYNGQPTGTNEPYRSTWVDYEIVKNNLDKYNGTGFVITEGYCGIDIDNIINPIAADEIIKHFNSYTELSPSKKGYHIIIRVDLKKLPIKEIEKKGFSIKQIKLDDKYYQKKGNYECYIGGLTNRYFTYTGDVINDAPVRECTNELIIFLERYMCKDSFIKEQVEKYLNIEEDIISIIMKSKQKDKFVKLYYNGDISDYGNDDSCADLALCNILAFYTKNDFDLIDKIFSKSALYREKWDRQDYKDMTINKARDLQGNFLYKSVGRPRTKEDKEKALLTLESLKNFLEFNNINIRYNEISKKVDIEWDFNEYSKEHINDHLPVIIHSKIKNDFKSCTVELINKYLNVIATENKYNPVLDIINSTTWDKHDYFGELVEILNIKDNLSKVLLYKWLYQCISLCKNDWNNPFGADGLLVLQGPQGIGKTSFVKKIAISPQFCDLGKYIDFRDKDTMRRCCSNWIVELAEIETTLKSDIEKLKAFITNEVDSYRLPFGINDLNLVRRTSLIGTCNSDKFLSDSTGNRRFWIIPIEKIDLDSLELFHTIGLWAQIYYETKNDLQGFRLTPVEIRQLNERNVNYEKELKGEAEIKELFEKENMTWVDMSVTEFKTYHSILSSFSLREIGSVLNKLDIKQETIIVHNKAKRVRNLPKCSTNLF